MGDEREFKVIKDEDALREFGFGKKVMCNGETRSGEEVFLESLAQIIDIDRADGKSGKVGEVVGYQFSELYPRTLGPPFDANTKSRVYKLIFDAVPEDFGNRGLAVRHDVIMKRDCDKRGSDVSDETFNIRRAVHIGAGNIPPQAYLDEGGAEKQILPIYLSGYVGEFNKRQVSAEQYLPHLNLQEILGVTDDPETIDKAVKKALDPVVLLHELLPIYRHKLEEAFGGPINGFDIDSNVFSLINLTDTLSKEASVIGLTEDERETLVKAFKHFTVKYVQNPELTTYIQIDGFPRHDILCSLVDAGNIRPGSRATHLGALLGHPSVYNKIKLRGSDIFSIFCRYIQTYLGKVEQIQGVRDEHIDKNQLNIGESPGLGLTITGLALATSYGVFDKAVREAGGTIHHYGSGSIDFRDFMLPAQEQLQILQEMGSTEDRKQARNIEIIYERKAIFKNRLHSIEGIREAK